MKEYDYKKQSPLGPDHYRLGRDQIRLLKLHPGSSTMDLKCNLVVRVTSITHHADAGDSESRLRALEPYDALSYHWGQKKKGVFVEVLAGDDSYRIAITPNLDAALRQLRSNQEYKFLWVDALCINQEDEEEKSSQIRKMSQIYNGAECVRVWLGLEDSTSAKAMEFVNKCLDLDDFDRLVHDSFASKEWAALSALMRRPWFNRRWIIQEIALAKKATLHCGKDSVPWRNFADALSLLERKQYEIRQLFRESTTFRNHPDYLGDLTELGAIQLVYAADNLFRKSEDGRITEHLLSLEALLSSLSAFEASEPRDTVYAILWLAKDAHPASKDAWVMDPEKPSAHSPGYTASSAGQFSPIYPRSAGGSPLLEGHAFGPGSTVSHLHRRPSESTSSYMESFGIYVPSENQGPAKRADLTLAPAIHINDEDESATQAVEGRVVVTRSAEEAIDHSNTGQAVLATPGRTQEHHTSLTLAANGDDAAREAVRTLLPPEPRSRKHSLNSEFDVESLFENRKKHKAASRFMNALESSRITVDYSKNVFLVFKDVLAFLFTRSNSLDMICRPWAPEYPGLPSWISRLSGSAFGLGAKGVYRRVNADPLVGRPGLDEKHYKASGFRRVTWKTKDGPDKRPFVKGFVLSTVKEKKSAATAGIVPSEWIEAGGWSVPDDQTQQVPDQFWRLLVGNRDANGKRPPSHWHLVCRDAFKRRPARGDLNTGEMIMYECPSPTREFLERVQCMTWSRRLVILDKLPHKKGRPPPPPNLGLAPSKVKKGDCICILFGCSVPVILRKFVNGQPANKQTACERCRYDNSQDDQNSQDGVPIPNSASGTLKPHVYYEFIGECYVHGMMDGEALEVQRRASIPDQKFELR